MTFPATKLKTARTIKDYTTTAHGYEITVPKGSIVTNATACGNDDNYRYWNDFQRVVEDLTGFKSSILHHDLTYYGLNIPAKVCEPYEA
jgi:hypothetical protein